MLTADVGFLSLETIVAHASGVVNTEADNQCLNCAANKHVDWSWCKGHTGVRRNEMDDGAAGWACGKNVKVWQDYDKSATWQPVTFKRRRTTTPQLNSRAASWFPKVYGVGQEFFVSHFTQWSVALQVSDGFQRDLLCDGLKWRLIWFKWVFCVFMGSRHAQFLCPNVMFDAAKSIVISKFWSRELQSWEVIWKSKWFVGPYHSIGQVLSECGSNQFSAILFVACQENPWAWVMNASCASFSL